VKVGRVSCFLHRQNGDRVQNEDRYRDQDPKLFVPVHTNGPVNQYSGKFQNNFYIIISPPASRLNHENPSLFLKNAAAQMTKETL
jgi:hypothetical protein